MPLREFAAVIFDLDGTLLDTLDDITRVGNSVLLGRGLGPRSRDAFRAAVGMGIEELYRRLLGDGADPVLVAELAKEAVLAHSRVEESVARPFPGIPELLDRLAGEGIPMGVLSNKPREAVTGSLARFFPGVVFSVVRGAMPGKPVKPGSKTALEMIESMGTSPVNTAMVGDGEPDVRTALAAGMVPVGCSWGFTPPERLLELGAVYLARTPGELGDILIQPGR